MHPDVEKSPSAKRRHLVAIAIVFEAALGLLGYGLAVAQDVPVQNRLEISVAVLARSVAALAPMLVLLAFLMGSCAKPLVDLRRHVETLVADLFGGASWLGLLAVAAAAGAGEELLFRGALQPLAVRWTDPWFGVAAVSLAFGLLHAASWTYFVVATITGLYLGWLAQNFNDLVAPIFVHAAYDFVALLALRRTTAVNAAAEWQR